MANPDLEPNALQKPVKGSVWLEGRARRKAITQREEANKLKVRKRDRMCRWPHCENCKTYKPRLEVAHVTAKGMGGDHGTVSDASHMILIDHLTHQSGPSSLEQHGRRVEPLTDQGTNGPCQFLARDERGEWYVVATEIAVGGPYERD